MSTFMWIMLVVAIVSVFFNILLLKDRSENKKKQREINAILDTVNKSIFAQTNVIRKELGKTEYSIQTMLEETIYSLKTIDKLATDSAKSQTDMATNAGFKKKG